MNERQVTKAEVHKIAKAARKRFLEAAREAKEAGDTQEVLRNVRNALIYRPSELRRAGW